MANLSNINIGIAVSTAGLSKGLSVATAKTERFASKVKTIGSRTKSTFGNIANGALGVASSMAKIASATVAAGAAIGSIYVKKAMSAIDATAKFSDSVGVSTEFLAAMSHQAQIAGTDGETLNKGFIKLQKSVAEASLGLSTATDALSILGLEYKDLLHLPLEQQFLMVADSFSQLEAGALKTKAATDLFGRSGASLLPLLNQGSAGLQQAAAESEKLGISFNRLDAAKVEQANDAITNLKGAITGVFNQIAIALAPAITDITDKITAWASSGEGAGYKISNAMGWVIEQLGRVGDFVNKARQGFLLLAEFVLNRVADMREGFSIFLTAAQKAFIAIHIAGAKAISGIVGLFRDGFNKVIEGLNTIGSKVGIELELIAETGIEKTLGDAIDKMQKKSDSLVVGLGQDEGAKQIRSLADAAGDTADKIAESVPFSQKLTQWWAKANDKAESMAEAQTNVSDMLSEELSTEQEKEKLNKDAGFAITKAGRFALNQGTPGRDGTSEKIDETNNILKQIRDKNNVAVYA